MIRKFSDSQVWTNSAGPDDQKVFRQSGLDKQCRPRGSENFQTVRSGQTVQAQMIRKFSDSQVWTNSAGPDDQKVFRQSGLDKQCWPRGSENFQTVRSGQTVQAQRIRKFSDSQVWTNSAGPEDQKIFRQSGLDKQCWPRGSESFQTVRSGQTVQAQMIRKFSDSQVWTNSAGPDDQKVFRQSGLDKQCRPRGSENFQTVRSGQTVQAQMIRKFSDSQVWTNSAGPDQTAPST